MNPLRVHSVAEVYLYLMVQRCVACGQGPLVAVAPHLGPPPHAGEGKCVRIETLCRACGAVSAVELDMRDALEEQPRLWNEIPVGEVGGVAVAINATEEPSAVIDVAEWLTLSSLIAEAARALESQAETAADKGLVRQLNTQAGRCLDEVIKFYLEGEELPPSDAFFGDRSRQQFRERPEMFSRSRLIGMRGKLPVVR